MRKFTFLMLVLLVVNSAYLAGFATPSIFYVTNILFHVGLGLALIGWMLMTDRRRLLPLLPAALLGLLITVVALARTFEISPLLAEAIRSKRWILQAHIAMAVLGSFGLLAYLRDQQRRVFAMLLVAGLAFPMGVATWRKAYPNPTDRIVNPLVVPTSMEEEANGPDGPFFPSSANTNTGKIIPANFFMESNLCKKCHEEIYNQWDKSVHHFASMNNQFYRKSIEYMQDVNSVKSTKWCAGCHDHAVFFNGRFEKPIKDQINTPEAQAGLGCMSCHAIVAVKDTMGNGGFTIEYPALHELVTSKNKLVNLTADFVTFADPEPHRKTFVKPFMRQDASEYCSTCHKVHLDVPVNNYRWVRGFNDYDNWQASGVSGQGARSFYYPKKSQNCVDCHMPLVPSKQAGQHDGVVHSHNFGAANTAVPLANQDHEQVKLVEDFLKNKQLSVDVFAIARGATAGGGVEGKATSDTPRLATTFAVGEESADMGIRAAGHAQPEGIGPINIIQPVVRRGEDVRIDVVVRTRAIGHFFPGGTVDAFDVWTELKGTDDKGRVIYWSGPLEDGNGPVEKGGHLYRNLMLDANGNEINKRNAFHTRSTLYVRLIPPGAADTVRFRVKIPKDAGDKIRLEAKVNYRKFAWYYTNYAYGGVPPPAPPDQAGPHFDNRKWLFSGDLSGVSGKMKQIPDVPVVAMASAVAELQVVDAKAPIPELKPVLNKDTRERWNDYGIGLLLQGDLKGAVKAFTNVTVAEPGYADGWLNVARAQIQEGNTDEAKPWLKKAEELGPSLGRVHFFKAMVQKAEGDLDGALQSLKKVDAIYPRDRVMLNQTARILFLQRKYPEAVNAANRVIRVDPEDVMAHYTLMLAYRGLGDEGKAAREEKLYRRFKADESSQAITGEVRRLSPEDNNERLSIHEHAGVADPEKYARAEKLYKETKHPMPATQRKTDVAPRTVQKAPHGAAIPTGGGR